MKITCPACDAEYNVDPSRIPATGLNMRCPQCSQSFRVASDGTTTAEGSAGGGTMLDGGGASLKNERFYVKRSTGKVFGPFDRSAIQLMLKSEKLSGDAEVSTDKQSWQSILEIPAFSQFVKDKPLPNLEGQNPRATMMSGWQSGSAAGAPDLPAPKSGGPPDLPAPKSAGVPDLPAPKRAGVPDLPAPKASGGPGLPTPKGVPDLPAPRAGVPDLPTPRAGVPDLPTPKGADLPAPKSDLPIPKAADLPVPRMEADAELPAPTNELPVPRASKSFEEDLFSDGPADAGDDDLFGGGGDDDDLFGDSSRDDDDLFGPPSEKPAPPAGGDDDLFGAPVAPKEDDLFGGGDDGDDLFGSSGGSAAESDIFGNNESIGDDDLFGSPSPAASKGDDFLGGDEGFSFLDDQPAAGGDDWGDNLFDDPSLGAQSSAALSEASAPLDDWGDDLLDRPAPKPRAPQASESIHDENDPFRPASSGIRQEEKPAAAAPEKAATVDQDRKRGGAPTALIGIVAAAVIGGGAFAAYTAFSGDETVTVNKPVAKVKDKVTVDMLKSDNFADYAILGDAASSPAAGEEGIWLLAHSLYLSRFPDAQAVKRADPVAQKLKDAKGGMDAVGRGAFEARSGNADAARAYLEGLASESGDVGFFANLSMGMGDVKAVEGELARSKAVAMPQPTENNANNAPPGATNSGTTGTNNAAGDIAAGTNGTNGAAGTNGTTGATNNETTAPAPQPAPKAAPAPEVNLAGLDDRARTALAAATKLDGKSQLPYYWLGRLERQLRKTDEAISALAKGHELAPKHVGTHVELGAAYYDNGDLNKAIELLEKVTGELAPQAGPSERAEAYHYAGLVHVARRDSDLAVEAFTKALNIDANRESTIKALAEEYERAQKYKEALTFFTTNKKLAKNDPNVMLGIVRSHIGLEQWQRAIATLEEGQKSFPDDAQFPYYLGQLFMKRGAFADAQKPLERAVEIDPGLLSAHATLAQLAWRMDKDVEKGERHVSEIVARPAGIDANVATQVAEYYALSGRRDTAEKWYREALRRDKNNWPARLALSKLLLEEGKQDQARELLERARQEGVQDVRLSAYLADAYRQAQDYDRAIDEINQVIEAFPKSEDYVFIRGRIHFDRGNYDTAQDDFQRAYDLNPRYHDAYFFVGRTAFERKDFQTALKIFRHVLDYKPDNGNYRFYMGRTLEAEGRSTQALEEYRKATAVDPAFGIENPMVYVFRGQLLSKLNYSKEGKADIARALELAPDSVTALKAMGDAEYRDQKYQDAIGHYEKALNLEPMQPETQARLGMALLFSERRTEAAQRLQLAIKYGHNDPEVFKRLGYLYKEMGQRAQAKEAFTKFLEKAQEQGDVPAATKREIMGQLETL